MLILTRRVGEDIIASGDIGNERVTFTVLGVKGNQVRIGIDAPNELKINRSEIQDRIDKEKKCNDLSC